MAQNVYGVNDSPSPRIWQPETAKLLEGGVLLDVANSAFKTATERAKKGTPVAVDVATRKAVLVKSAKVYSIVGGSDTEIQVNKKHELVVGEYLAHTVGGTAYAITDIDTESETTHDIVTVGTTLGAIAAGTVLFVSSATGATAAVAANTPNGLLAEDVDITLDNRHVGVVVSALNVHENRLPFGLTDYMKTSLSSRFHLI